MDLTQILLNTQNPQTQKAAEGQLKSAEQTAPAQYLTALAEELCQEAKPVVSRQLAGILLKNSLAVGKKLYQQADEALQQHIKTKVLSSLESRETVVRNTAAQVLSKIGAIEIPEGRWPQLIGVLVAAVSSSSLDAKQSGLTTLGFLAEELAFLVTRKNVKLPDEQCKSILQAVLTGVKEPETTVKLAATKALSHSILLTFENLADGERAFIMTSIEAACKDTDTNVQIAGLECLLQIASEYYDHIGPYMNGVSQLTWNAIQNCPESVGIPAMEFWSTICEEELYLKELAEDCAEKKEVPPRISQNFIAQALQLLWPVLQETLTKKTCEENEDDEWNISMAAGACLSLVAQVVGDAITEPVLKFVNENFTNEKWTHREAAILAYGSIMEGPSQEKLSGLVSQSLQHLVKALDDQSAAVRDTCAWTIGQIAKVHTSLLTPHVLEMLNLVIPKLKDEPRVAVNICYVLDTLWNNIQGQMEPDRRWPTTSILSATFTVTVDNLLDRAEQQDASEKNLRDTVYNTLSTIILKCGDDCVAGVERLMSVLMQRLGSSCQFTKSHELAQLQGQLCGCLQVASVRLPAESIVRESSTLFKLYSQVLQITNSGGLSIHEDALVAIGALALAIGSSFSPFMKDFSPFLTIGLHNYQEVQVCMSSVSVVGDVARAMGSDMLPYCESICSALYNDLQNPEVDRKIKPGIMTCFGDIALAIGKDFEQFMPAVTTVLQEASATRISHGPPENDEWVEYLHQLREGVLRAYTGIIQALRECNEVFRFKDNVNSVLELIAAIVDDVFNSDVHKAALGVLIDLVLAYQNELTKHIIDKSWLRKAIELGNADPNCAVYARNLQGKLEALKN
eukprot:GHVL01024276.1.p1 GENE.GHVL01024276.1~~GHVL01024276.1.p1  ORF type:complete len:853 (+),score=138.01 GHVL01024276.1:57-2615(+)